MKNNILWLITARSGSKSVPNKNIKKLSRIPLIGYKILTALSISSKDNVWVSTDSDEYAKISKEYGACVPFIRPRDLANDSSSSVDVVLHAMDYAEKIGRSYDYIGLLEPTSPFVYFNDIDCAVNNLELCTEADAIVAVKESRPNTIFIQDDKKYLDIVGERIRCLRNYGREYFNREITPSGGFYISRWLSFRNNCGFYSTKTLSYMLSDVSAIEIDEHIDWLWAEFLINEKQIKTNKLWKKELDKNYG
jgi:CMP-N,N'-diacetyllegionaminic acid synthase